MPTSNNHVRLWAAYLQLRSSGKLQLVEVSRVGRVAHLVCHVLRGARDGDVLYVAAMGAGLLARQRTARRSGVQLLLLLGIRALDVMCAAALRRERLSQKDRPSINYAECSGFPQSPQQMRGMAAGSKRAGEGRSARHSDCDSALC
jgi:hypothetical protein